jgi:hypothetical protein
VVSLILGLSALGLALTIFRRPAAAGTTVMLWSPVVRRWLNSGKVSRDAMGRSARWFGVIQGLSFLLYAVLLLANALLRAI